MGEPAVPQYQIIFVTNSFYLGATAKTDPVWLQKLIELGALVKTDLLVTSERNSSQPFTAIYWIDEVRAKGHVELPKRPHTPAQFSVNTKPNLN